MQRLGKTSKNSANLVGSLKIISFLIKGEIQCLLTSATVLLTISRTPWSTDSSLRSYEVLNWSTNSPYFVEPKGSIPNSQETATCHYTEPDQSSPCPHSKFWRSILILSSHLRLVSPVVLSLRSPHQPLYALLSPIRATYPAHHILIWSPE